MRIKDDCFKKEDKQRICLDLKELLAQPSDKQQRPCPGCRFTFGSEKSITSTKNCSAKCEFVAGQMSSDPNKYPIESGVVSLVYALYTMRLMMPCWSCEGHMNKAQEIVKLPSIWFYSTSHFYPKLLAQYIDNLFAYKKIKTSWRISILAFSQSLFSTTYSLEPQVSLNEDLDLADLQNDMNRIAKDMRFSMLRDTRSYLKRAGH